ncbi:MAG: hypothetical protein AAGE37_08680 [Pseudomonadota bacterium]
MANPKRLVTIREDPFYPNVHVEISPGPAGEMLDREFDNYPLARVYADQLVAHNDWLLIDLLGSHLATV